MHQSNYHVLNIRNIKSEDMDSLTEFLFEIGAKGTQEDLDFIQADRHYNPVTVSKERTKMKVYFDLPASAEEIERLMGRWPEIQMDSETCENQDWLSEWKKGFKPFEIGQGFWVVPPWCEIPSDAKDYCLMEPGMAFGTGTHETTQIAASFILEHSRSCPGAKGSLLDVGTGTGLLAIVAEKSGFAPIKANDIDVEALRVARENCVLNKTSNVEVLKESISEIQEKFNWVVANIIDGVLIEIQEHLRRCLLPSGVLVLTGILKEREALFLNEFNLEGFAIVSRKEKGEWVGYQLEILDS